MPQLARLDLEVFLAAVEQGAQVVDARVITRYADGHLPGSLSIELRPVFATWLGWLVDASRPVVFVLDDDQDRHELVRQCLTVGVEMLAGELEGGYSTWAAAGLPVTTVDLIGAADLERETVVDVRQRDEFLSGHIPGARNVELGALGEAADRIPRGRLVVMCGHGERAMTGASLLEQSGHVGLAVLAGGPDDWAAASAAPLATGP
jgi:rhodanese-related sulfurtransferase